MRPKALGHRVEGPRERALLAAALLGRAGVEVAGRDALGDVLQARDRQRDPAREQASSSREPAHDDDRGRGRGRGGDDHDDDRDDDSRDEDDDGRGRGRGGDDDD